MTLKEIIKEIWQVSLKSFSFLNKIEHLEVNE